MHLPRTFVAALLLWLGMPAPAAAIEPALLESLRTGGHVLYFRHAATEWSQADRHQDAGWESCAPAEMRQLSAAGRDTARRVGEAMRRLRIPVARVVASEFCRTMETARLLDLGPVETSRGLVNMTHAQHAGGVDALARRARTLMATMPPEGANTVLVGHGNVFMLVSDRRPVEAGAVVLRPDGAGGFEVVAHVAPAEWLALANGQQQPGGRR